VNIISAITKRFELLVYKTMYDDLKNLIFVNLHGFLKNRFVGVRFFCAEFN
jgi:hypothetical protein